MAHSFFEYRGRCVRVHDLDIVVALLLFDDVLARSDGDVQGKLRRIVREWIGHLDAWGPGCIDLALDEVLDSVVSAKAMGALIEDAQKELRSHGDEVPSDYINRRLGLVGNRALRSVSVPAMHEALVQMASVLHADGGASP